MTGYILALADYAAAHGLIEPEDRTIAVNLLLDAMGESSLGDEPAAEGLELHEILDALCDAAVSKGLISDSVTERDLFDTKLMGILTPMPREVRTKFAGLYARSPKEATDWYYAFSQATNYIRADRIARDRKWKYPCEYGTLDITINLSKPEKDPRAIAAARLAAQTSYPKCQLCAENEGYAGRIDHPARQNHRVIPLKIAGGDWFLQYSPYVYYNEHCIVFNSQHIPMVIDRAVFTKLFDFIAQFPHYTVGSNADLPIVGGSILSHEHFQGGCYTFPMAEAPAETPLTFKGYEQITADIVRWPMSVIRLSCADRQPLEELSDKILRCWRGYSDESAFIFAETDGVPHNTITPIARMRDGKFEIDLVLRNNITTDDCPLGYFHPHSELHHIKKENIGLIEVMGLAVLPSRLKNEMAALANDVLAGADIRADEQLAKHADWIDEIKTRRTLTAENISSVLEEEIGAVFARVLEYAGVYKRTEAGRAAFLRFCEAVDSFE